MASVRRVMGGLAAVLAVVGLVGCSDDQPSKEEFVDQMMTNGVTPRGGDEEDRWRDVWGCTYDEVSSTDLLDRMMELDAGADIPDDLSADVSRVLGGCLSEVPPDASTTVPGVPDPTALTPTSAQPGAP